MLEIITGQAKNYKDSIQEIFKANPNLIKEYHFDPDMGQTLEEHLQEIKVPGIKVEVRHDRAGNTMIRKSLENNYEFNLDEMMNFNVEKETNDLFTELQNQLKNSPPKHIDETPSQFYSNDIPLKVFELTKQRSRQVINDEEYSQAVEAIIPNDLNTAQKYTLAVQFKKLIEDDLQINGQKYSSDFYT